MDRSDLQQLGKAFDLAKTIAGFAASTLVRKKRELEKQLAAPLVAATGCDLARELQAKIARARDQLLTFCDYPGEVDVTNNTSGRKLSPCVIQRKVTNGYRVLWVAQAEADVRTSLRRHHRHPGLNTPQANMLASRPPRGWVIAGVRAFTAAMGFNWLIAGADAHAKNYSLLLAGGGVRLALLYDIASILPYDGFDLRKVKLAMKVGGDYKLDQIRLRQWQKFARETRADADQLIATLRHMAARLPDQVSAVRDRARKEGLKDVVVERLANRLIERARENERLLVGDPAADR